MSRKSSDPRRYRGRVRSRSVRPQVQAMEIRRLLATFTVINTNDVGNGSLRQAITVANSSPGADLISFEIPGTGVQTIRPATELPTITEAVTIDGTRQPGFAGTPIVEL